MDDPRDVETKTKLLEESNVGKAESLAADDSTPFSTSREKGSLAAVASNGPSIDAESGPNMVSQSLTNKDVGKIDSQSLADGNVVIDKSGLSQTTASMSKVVEEDSSTPSTDRKGNHEHTTEKQNTEAGSESNTSTQQDAKVGTLEENQKGKALGSAKEAKTESTDTIDHAKNDKFVSQCATPSLQSVGAASAAQAIKRESMPEDEPRDDLVKRKTQPKKDNGKCGKTAYTPYNQLDLKPADVLLGRGKRATLWDGNKRYKQLIRSYVASYVRAEKNRDKTSITIRIVDHVHMLGGRFVKEDLKTGQLSEVNDDVARLKVGQALRHRLRAMEQGLEDDSIPDDDAAGVPPGSLSQDNGRAFAAMIPDSSNEHVLLSAKKRKQLKLQQATAKSEQGETNKGGGNGNLHILLEALQYQGDTTTQKKKASLLDDTEDSTPAVGRAAATSHGIAQLSQLALYQNQGEGMSLPGIGRPTREELQMAGLLQNANNMSGGISAATMPPSYSSYLQGMSPSDAARLAAAKAESIGRPPALAHDSLELHQAAMMAPALSHNVSRELQQAMMPPAPLSRNVSRELQQAMMAPALSRGTSLEQMALRNALGDQELQQLRLLAGRTGNPFPGLDQPASLVEQQEKRSSFRDMNERRFDPMALDPMFLAGRRPSATQDDMDRSIMAARVADEARIQNLLRAQSLLQHNASERDKEVSAIQRQLVNGQHISHMGLADDASKGLTLSERQLLSQLQSPHSSLLSQQQGNQRDVGGLVRRLLEKQSNQTNPANASVAHESTANSVHGHALQQKKPTDPSAEVATRSISGREQKPAGSAVPPEVADLMKQYPQYFKDQYMPNGLDKDNKAAGHEHPQEGAQGPYGTKRSRGDLLGMDDESEPEAIAKRTRESYGNARLGYAFANPAMVPAAAGLNQMQMFEKEATQKKD